MNIEEIRIQKDYFFTLKEKITYNPIVADLYRQMVVDPYLSRKSDYLHVSEDGEVFDFFDFSAVMNQDLVGLVPYNPPFKNRADRVERCLSIWRSDFYRIQSVKDIQSVNLCGDKFCLNCQSMLAAKRQAKYSPILSALADQYDVYHFVLTVPNCDYSILEYVVNKMYKSIGHLFRYFRGNLKVKGVDLLQYGCVGGLRSLEITYNHKEQSFHPHFHCLLVLDKGLDLPKIYKNKFSFSSGKLVRKFSDLEILLQKIWYLLYNGVKVTKQNIEELKQGYSVVLDDAKGHYHEVFKYACKGVFEDDCVLFRDYKKFRALFQTLFHRRIIQGYGVLAKINDDDRQVLEDDLNELYLSIVAQLRSFEDPVLMIDKFDEILNRQDISYISKTNLRRIMLEGDLCGEK